MADLSARDPGRPRLELLGDCVHCGLCLPACPTYQLDGEEMDSPRGRIHLMLGIAQGDPVDPGTVQHFDSCLGCLACVTACPSGVQYGTLIEHTRAEVEPHAERSRSDRAMRALIFAVFPYPGRLRVAAVGLRAAQRTGLTRILGRSKGFRRAAPRLSAMVAIAPDLRGQPRVRVTDLARPADAAPRGRVALLTGCVQSVFFAGVNDATARVLAAEGFEVVVPPAQGCCGALGLHVGRHDEALAMARALIAAIPTDVDAIITNAAGCGSSLKDYGVLLASDPEWASRAAAFAAKTVDITEFLAGIEPVAALHPLPVVVAYHDACHLSNAQSIRRQPRDLLRRIPGLQLHEVTDGDTCCGSAGVYNVLNPEPAVRLGERKARNVAATGADVLVAGNPGCLMQVQRFLAENGSPIPSMHTVEVLAAALSADDARGLVARLR